jgi:drug/metabolite transporter (DMT)-like permease
MNPKHIQGIKFALLTAFISGLANFLNKEVIISGINPVCLAALKNALVGIIFLGVALPLFQKHKPSKSDLPKFLLIAVIGGGIPFILFFKGLALSTAIKGSFIHKTLFVWVALWSLIFFKEKFNKYQFAALVILAISILPAIKFKFFAWGRGEIMILAATLLWSIEVMFVKKFMQKIDYRFLAAARMAMGALVIFAYGLYSGDLAGMQELTAASWLKVLVVSAFLFGYVLTWYRALSLAPASLITSILTLAFPVTMLASGFKSFSFPAPPDLISSLFIASGVILFINEFFEKWQLKSKILTE